MYRNSEGYSDPTAGEAIANVMRENGRMRKEYSDYRKAKRKKNRQARKAAEERNRFETR
ncbi:MAG: hypothetical protein LUC38_03280 [Oscillospiraceae bacterium]|nr:hypothetical protein [Ruminococcus sp.]MCD8344965.1 hypothetical protein [Oscillospiraceae bacterium]